MILFVPLFLLVFATIADLRRREIPDRYPVSLICVAVVAAAFNLASIRWWMIVTGSMVGFAIGYVMFRFAQFGGGDAKVLIGVGAILGPVGIWFYLFWMAVAGGVLALVAKFRGQRDYAYGPALLLGYIGYLFYPADILRTLRELMG